MRAAAEARVTPANPSAFCDVAARSARSRARPRRQVIATSRTDYAAVAAAVGVTFFSDADDFVEEVRVQRLAAGCRAR